MQHVLRYAYTVQPTYAGYICRLGVASQLRASTVHSHSAAMYHEANNCVHTYVAALFFVSLCAVYLHSEERDELTATTTNNSNIATTSTDTTTDGNTTDVAPVIGVNGLTSGRSGSAAGDGTGDAISTSSTATSRYGLTSSSM
jgi:hypothetical protein